MNGAPWEGDEGAKAVLIFDDEASGAVVIFDDRRISA
jgi:hypothetical protein